jgi:FKBP-type peptidyl-prolyl cis-trans isomerase FkpA
MRTRLPWFLLGFVFLILGCRSTPKQSPDISSVPVVTDTPEPQFRPLTFVDKPELQVGTGPMDAGDPPEFSQTDSGLKYRVLRSSDGTKPTATSTVTVNYRGWLNSGKVFDSSYERGKPTTFALGDVIDGWTEGMQLVGEGGMIELYVPSRLGYGERGSPGSIPPHSNLHFIVELVNVD